MIADENHSDDAGAHAPRVEIVRGAPTDEDLAALAGVIPAAYLEEAAGATAEGCDDAADLWRTSRRMRRRPTGPWGRALG